MRMNVGTVGLEGWRMTLEFWIWSPDGVVATEITVPVLGRRRGRYSIAMPRVSKMKSTEP